MNYGKNVGIIPLTDAAGITKPYNYPSHKGIDIGWAETPECAVLAWQDGVVVQRGYGSEVGNYIVVEHYYDSTDEKRWTGYIHLAYFPTVKVGEKVYLGKQMGNAARGNTGVSNGTHLHLYLTKCVSQKVPYTWDTMLANVTNPYDYLYYSKEFNTVYLSKEWKKELKKITYPQPVARNIKVHQVDIKSDTRRLRSTPSISGQAYDEYCTKGIYNVLDMTFIDDYTWAKIGDINGNIFWVAVMSGEDLPAKVYVYPQPVERDTSVQQVDIKSDTRKLRALPSLNGEVYDELCKKGLYNVQKWETADGYDWALIDVINDDQFWVAVMAGEDLPIIKNWEELYLAEKAKAEKLEAELNQLKAQTEEQDKIITKLEVEREEILLKLEKTELDLVSVDQKLQKAKGFAQQIINL